MFWKLFKCDCDKRLGDLERQIGGWQFRANEATVESLIWKLRDSNIRLPAEFIQSIVQQINDLQIKKGAL